MVTKFGAKTTMEVLGGDDGIAGITSSSLRVFSDADYEALEPLIVTKRGQNIEICLHHILTTL